MTASLGFGNQNAFALTPNETQDQRPSTLEAGNDRPSKLPQSAGFAATPGQARSESVPKLQSLLSRKLRASAHEPPHSGRLFPSRKWALDVEHSQARTLK